MRPMLAGKLDYSKLKYPVFVSPKYDGIRFLMVNGVAFSRAMKELPNRHLQRMASTLPHGLDGEVIVGEPTAQNCMQATSSAVMSYEGDPDFVFYIFDRWDIPHMPYSERLSILSAQLSLRTPNVRLVPQALCLDEQDAMLEIDGVCQSGYEGAIVRHANSLYKYGRSTTREGSLLKYKEFADEEARVVGFEELLHNLNDPEESEIGLQKRSQLSENMVPGNCLGSLVVESSKYPMRYRIGTGFTQADRYEIWANQRFYLGKLVKYKFQAHGIKDVPRLPVFLGFRDEIDT